MSDKVIICPICGQSEFNEENGKYKCKYCEAVWEKTLDDNTIIDLRQAHNFHRLYNFEKAEMLYNDIYKDSDDENVKMMCNYGALLALFGVNFIKDKENNIITTLANYQEDYDSVKESKYYKEIINSNYKCDYVDKLNEIDKEYERLKKELAEKPEYDIFICCKVTPLDSNNDNARTIDNQRALELYDKLSKQFKVFYSEVDLSGVDYDAQIYSALMRSRTILVISSCREYLESCWVQSEWRRWLNFIEVEKKEKKSLFLFKLKSFVLPYKLSRINVISEEDKLLRKIESFIYELREIEIDSSIHEARHYRNSGHFQESYNILSQLAADYKNDYRPWTELIEWLEYTGVNQDDIRYKKFLNEALNRADEKDKNKILKDYGYLLDVKKEEVREDKSIIENKLNEAKTKVIFKKYQEAENIYMELCEKHIDYRPWYGLFELLVIQNIDKKDDRYKIYFEQALSLCNDKDKKEEITGNYKLLFKVKNINEIAKPKQPVKEKDVPTIKCPICGESNYKRSGDNYECNCCKSLFTINDNNIETIKCPICCGENYTSLGDNKYRCLICETTFDVSRKLEVTENALKELKEKGDECYSKGNYKKAVYWYLLSAEKGHADAQYNLGLCYFDGKGIKKDLQQTISWYKKAAEQGHAEAQCNLGAIYVFGPRVTRDYKNGVNWYASAAEKGLSNAQFGLAMCYYFGYGVSQDYNQSVYWHTKAANQGHIYAQCKLGSCYFCGKGAAENYDQAIYWYTKSSEKGCAEAHRCLGACYEYGKGVTQDYKVAISWYEKAADQGDSIAQNILGELYYHGKGVKKDYEKAVYWFQKAAFQDYVEAEYNLGLCYYNGYGVKKDYKLAAIWYKKAADQGYAKAQYQLGTFYYFGDGVEKNRNKAFGLYNEAAKQGYVEAQFAVGLCYEDSFDFNKAVYWYTKAAEQGLKKAAKKLKCLKK